ncbi:MAG: ribonuclease H-like domain-containing protein [Terriglobia bacterium]
MTPTLRQRLAGLSAARPRPGQRNAEHSLRPIVSRSASAEGVAVSEEFVPFGVRGGLEGLPAAEPQLAALLIRTPEARIPPLSEWLFLDLETTGLAGGTGTYAFLVGLAQLTPHGFRVRQFFLRDLAEEHTLLARLAPVLRAARVLVTYNGRLFDAPVLETRFRLARMPAGLDALLHLDLLYPARRLWKCRWGSAQLAVLERRLLGFERTEDVPGALIPQLYFTYLRGGDEQSLRVVFQHNRDDLLTLAALAARMLHLLAAPEGESCDPLELLGLARLHERARPAGRARTLYQRALTGSLPVEVERAAQFRLSRLYKRQPDYHRALSLWQELVESGTTQLDRETLEACRELAICYEHRLGNLEAAARATRSALARLEEALAGMPENGHRYRRARAAFIHRLQRLTRPRPRSSRPSFRGESR